MLSETFFPEEMKGVLVSLVALGKFVLLLFLTNKWHYNNKTN